METQQKPKSMTERFVELEDTVMALRGVAVDHNSAIRNTAENQAAANSLLTAMASEFAALIQLVQEGSPISEEAVEKRARENKIKSMKVNIQKAVDDGSLEASDTITEDSMVEIELDNGEYAFQPVKNLKESVRSEIVGKPVFDAKGKDYKVTASYKGVDSNGKTEQTV